MYGPGSTGLDITISSALRAAAFTDLYAYASERPSLPGGVDACVSSPVVLTNKLMFEAKEIVPQNTDWIVLVFFVVFAKMFFYPANSSVFENVKIAFHIFSYRCLAVR